MLKRLLTILKAKLSRVLDRAENPTEILDYSYEQQLEQIQNFRRGLTQLVASKKQLQAQRDAKQRELAKLHAGARTALAAGDEELARRALERKQLLADELTGLDQEVVELESQQEQMTARERQLRANLARFRTQKEITKAQYEAAKAAVSASEAASGLSGQLGDSSLAVQRTLDKVEGMKARAAALSELEASGTLTGLASGETDLDRQIHELVAGSTVDNELARIKQELAPAQPPAALPPATEPEQRS